jgi:hypothetical protein
MLALIGTRNVLGPEWIAQATEWGARTLESIRDFPPVDAHLFETLDRVEVVSLRGRVTQAHRVRVAIMNRQLEIVADILTRWADAARP